MTARREDPRHAAELPATLFWTLGEAIGTTRNISEKGAALTLTKGGIPGANESCEVSFVLPARPEPVACRARMRWFVASGSRTLVGVEFVERLTPELMSEIVGVAGESD